MSITIKSGATSDTLTVDATSKAGRVTNYDTAGRVLSADSKATYSAGTALFTSPATPTDMFIINGSASKTVRIISLKMGVWAQTAAGVNTYYLIRRTSANSGGTAVTTTIVKHDTNDGAATAVAQHYTANPTTGSSSGQIATWKIGSPISTSLVEFSTHELLPMSIDGMYRPIVLRGTAEGLAVNFNGAALPGGAANCCFTVTWTEE